MKIDGSIEGFIEREKEFYGKIGFTSDFVEKCSDRSPEFSKLIANVNEKRKEQKKPFTIFFNEADKMYNEVGIRREPIKKLRSYIVHCVNRWKALDKIKALGEKKNLKFYNDLGFTHSLFSGKNKDNMKNASELKELIYKNLDSLLNNDIFVEDIGFNEKEKKNFKSSNRNKNYKTAISEYINKKKFIYYLLLKYDIKPHINGERTPDISFFELLPRISSPHVGEKHPEPDESFLNNIEGINLLEVGEYYKQLDGLRDFEEQVQTPDELFPGPGDLTFSLPEGERCLSENDVLEFQKAMSSKGENPNPYNPDKDITKSPHDGQTSKRPNKRRFRDKTTASRSVSSSNGESQGPKKDEKRKTRRLL